MKLRVRCHRTWVVGTPVAVAVRPEKLRLCTDTGSDGVNRVRGVIEEIAYLGDVSIYHVRVAGDLMVTMTRANVHPRAERALTWGQEVAMEWLPDSGVVLAD